MRAPPQSGVKRFEQISENSASVRLWSLSMFEQVPENSFFAAGGLLGCLSPALADRELAGTAC